MQLDEMLSHMHAGGGIRTSEQALLSHGFWMFLLKTTQEDLSGETGLSMQTEELLVVHEELKD